MVGTLYTILTGEHGLQGERGHVKILRAEVGVRGFHDRHPARPSKLGGAPRTRARMRARVGKARSY